MAFGWNICEDLLQIFCKAHIEHFIRFIQYYRMNVRQADGLTAHQVEETAGRCHDDLHTTAQGSDLRIYRRTSVNG